MSATISRRLFTVEEFIRLDQLHFFAPDERLELIDGEIHPMSPIGYRHAGVVDGLVRWLYRHLDPAWFVRCQNPLRLGGKNLPQPDLHVVRSRPDNYTQSHATPSDTVLVIEVADSTADVDLGKKKEIYAQAGIPEYWVFDLTENTLECFTAPEGGAYQNHRRLTAADAATSATLGITLPLAEILRPGL
jgi:Uma2 family endonuclease